MRAILCRVWHSGVVLGAYGYSEFFSIYCCLVAIGQKKLLGCTWESLCNTLCVRFGRDRHQLLIRQFCAIKQKGSVQEYIDAFEHLMNQLLSYSDEVHLTWGYHAKSLG